jgi:hypothetical protein
MAHVTVSSIQTARLLDEFQTAAHQARRAVTILANFATSITTQMDITGTPSVQQGLPSAAEAYVQADAKMKTLYMLIPLEDEDVTAAMQLMVRGEYVSVKVAND